MRRILLMIGLGTWLAACGGDDSNGGSNGGDLSFDEMCERGATKLCDRMSTCPGAEPLSNCVATIKALNCSGGSEMFCPSGSTYQPNKATACLDAVDAAGCAVLNAQPAACLPTALCTSSQTSTPPISTPGEACQALGDPGTCDAKATICYAAGTGSSCPDRALCVGNASGMTCAARCTTDADCASAGLVCVQGCAMTILNGFCVTPKLKETFVQSTCTHGNAGGLTGWTR